MFVKKRNGSIEQVQFDKITQRIEKLVNENEKKFIDPVIVAQKVVASIFPGITTEELDLESAKIAINLCTTHHLYALLAGKILVSNLHKKTLNTFVEKQELIQQELGILDDNWLLWIKENREEINGIINYDNDYIYDYFGFKTLERSYLIKNKNGIIERPQDMLLRVASFINQGDLGLTKKTYILMSKGYYTHASPTLFNAGNRRSQLSSCFLVGSDDSLDGITKTWADVSKISKWGGGIGLHVSNIRAKDSLIRGTNGPSSGIIPMLKVYNEIARYIDQGGKRKGSIAIYLETHHADIMAFLDLRKNFGAETERARDLFLAVWISDLFMKQVESDSDWYLMCPDKCPGLTDVYGDEYDKLYWQYVHENKFNKKIKARDVMKAILDSQLETGTPYIGFKDNVNNKSNQKNIGVIKSSNLCVHENTLILTNQGYKNIKSLKDQEVSIWNGDQWSNVTVKQTGSNQNLIRVNLSNGSYLDCTPEHKFYVQEDSNITEVPANKLKIDNKLIKFNLPDPIEFNNTEFKYDNKLEVPFNASINNRLRWFEDYCDINGLLLESNELQVSSNSKDFLFNVRLMLHTLGVESIINKDSLLIGSNDLYKLTELGCSLTKLKINKVKPQRSDTQFVKVLSIEESYQNVDTYCFTEPLKHMGIFNGILTGQCIEIVEYSDANEYAVCNLASIAINKCVDEFIFNKNDEWLIYTKDNCKYCTWTKSLLTNKGIVYLDIKNKLPANIKATTYPQIFHNNKHIGGFDKLYEYTKGIFNYEKLYDIAYIATINLNKIIDINYYPVIEAKRSNLKHRPIGLGIQGLADALVLLKIQFDSDESVEFNSKMMETIYLAAVTASNDISKERYNILKDVIDKIDVDQLPEYYDANFNIDNNNLNEIYHNLKLNRCELSNLNNKFGAYSTFEGSPISKGQFQFDLWSLDNSKLLYYDKWVSLREEVIKYGVRNSLLTALMPTASTSQILGNNECFEYFTNNIYSRRTLAGDFPLVNKYLIDDLYNLNLWSNDMKQLILANNGSINNFNNIPEQIKSLYKTVWEIKQVWVLKNAIARGPFNDQTQSMNIFMQVPDYQKLYSSHFYAWKNGLKTGIYYLRSKPSKEAVKITVDANINKKLEEITSNEHEVCESCSA
jgi:ribonucleotide reductase alpha subunit